MKWLRFAVSPLILFCVVAHVGTQYEAAVNAATNDDADARIDAILQGYENDVAEKQPSWTSHPLVWVGGGIALFVTWKLFRAMTKTYSGTGEEVFRQAAKDGRVKIVHRDPYE